MVLTVPHLSNTAILHIDVDAATDRTCLTDSLDDLFAHRRASFRICLLQKSHWLNDSFSLPLLLAGFKRTVSLRPCFAFGNLLWRKGMNYARSKLRGIRTNRESLAQLSPPNVS